MPTAEAARTKGAEVTQNWYRALPEFESGARAARRAEHSVVIVRRETSRQEAESVTAQLVKRNHGVLGEPMIVRNHYDEVIAPQYPLCDGAAGAELPAKWRPERQRDGRAGS